jgi:hypothetical protein
MYWPGVVALMFLGVFVVGFAATFVGIVRLIFRRPHAPGWTAPFVERVAHSQKRMQDFYFSQEYRLERRLIGGGFTAGLLSMAIIAALVVIFGENGRLSLN